MRTVRAERVIQVVLFFLQLTETHRAVRKQREEYRRYHIRDAGDDAPEIREEQGVVESGRAVEEERVDDTEEVLDIQEMHRLVRGGRCDRLHSPDYSVSLVTAAPI